MTDRGIPEQIKTGFNMLVPEEDPTENIASIVLVFMENAIKSADIYVKHAKRNSITAEDIKRGLMLEVFFTKQRPNMLEQCEKMKETLKKILDEDDSDEELEIYEDVEDEEFKESKCKCPMCGCMNTIYTRWEGFTPETTIEKVMFNHINNIN